MMKALSTVEGVALMLDPEFDMVTAAAPLFARVQDVPILSRPARR